MLKRTILLVLFSCFLLGAQEAVPRSDLALEMKLSNLSGMIHLDPLYGTLFSLKYHVTRKMAVRFGFEPTYSGTNNQTEQTDSLGSALFYREKQYYKGLGFNLDFLYLFPASSSVKLYLGGGPSLFMKNVKELNNTYKLRVYDVHVLTGAVWFVKNNFSLGLEYQWALERETMKHTYDMPDGQKTIDRSFVKMYSKPVTLVLSLYF